MRTITQTLNMTPGGVPPVIHVSQYDSDFTITFTLFSLFGGFTIESGTTAQIRGTKSSGTGYSADAAINISAKTVTVTGNAQMTAAAGQNIFEIVLKKNNKEISSKNFILHVERAALDADTITDESVLKELDAIIEGAETATQAAEEAEDAADRAEAAAQSLVIDSTPTQGSSNAVSSGGVYAIVTELDEKLDETDFIARKASDTLAVNGKNAILLYNITNGETANIYTTLLKAGHSYKLTPDKTTWEYKTPASGQTLFRIFQVTEENGQEVETIIYTKPIGGEIDTSIMLQTPDNLKYMIFFIRCVKTEVLRIKITDLGETNPVIPGLSIEAKRALLACFEHVVWTNEHGQDYYDALREALSEDEYIYKLDAPLTADGSTGYVITDVAPFIKKRSFSILADYTEGDIDFTVSNVVSTTIMYVAGDGAGTYVILSTYKTTNAQNVNTRATIFNTQYLVREPKENCGNRRIKFAISYDSETEKVTSLISLNGIIVTPYTDTTENDVVFYASENVLSLGVNAEQTEVLKGTINEAKILNHTLTLAEMESYVTDVD